MIVISWLLIDICDYVIFYDSTGSRAFLSAEKIKQPSPLELFFSCLPACRLGNEHQRKIHVDFMG